MTSIDERIRAALAAEEAHLIAEFEEFSEEPGYFTQAFSIFKGKTWWAATILFVTQSIIFVAAVWAAIHFFRADTVLDALRWGLPAAVGFLASLTMKLTFWPQMHINRLERQLKRMELLMLAKKEA